MTAEPLGCDAFEDGDFAFAAEDRVDRGLEQQLDLLFALDDRDFVDRTRRHRRTAPRHVAELVVGLHWIRGADACDQVLVKPLDRVAQLFTSP
jgi:hypothetical protein